MQALVDITLQKVWKDNANAGNTRPNEVTFKLKRTLLTPPVWSSKTRRLARTVCLR